MADGSTPKEPRSYGKLARAGGGWTIWRQVTSLAIQIPTSMVMARLLSPTEFGIAAVATMVVQFGYRLTQFGLNAALVRTKTLTRQHETSVFVFNVVMGIVAYVACAVAAPWVGRFFNSPESGYLIPLSALVFLIAPFGTVPGALLTRQFRYRELAGLGFLDILFASGTSLVMAAAGFSYWSLPGGALAGVLASTVRRAMLARWRIGFGFSWSAFRELAAYGGGIQTKRFIQYGASNLDTLIIGRVLGVTPLGLYDKGFSTVARMTQRLTFGTGVTFRAMAAIADEPERFRRAFQKTFLLAGLMTLPMLTTAALVASDLFLVMYGPQWVASVPVFQLLCLAGACQTLGLYVGSANEAAGRVWRQAGGQAVALIALGAGVWLGATTRGVTGAAAGMAFAGAVDLVLSSAILVGSSPLSFRDLTRPLLAPLACLAGLVPVLVGSRRLAVGAGAENSVVLLLIQLLVATSSVVAFAAFYRAADYRAVAADFVEDLAPKLPARAARWLVARFSSQPQTLSPALGPPSPGDSTR